MLTENKMFLGNVSFGKNDFFDHVIKGIQTKNVPGDFTYGFYPMPAEMTITNPKMSSFGSRYPQDDFEFGFYPMPAEMTMTNPKMSFGEKRKRKRSSKGKFVGYTKSKSGRSCKVYKKNNKKVYGNGKPLKRNQKVTKRK